MAWLMDTETGYASCQICTAITRTNLNSVFSVLDNLRKVNCIVGFIYRIVASTNTCYYSENQVFGGVTIRVLCSKRGCY